MSCRECRSLIEKYLDGLIESAELNELRAHVEACSVCRQQFESVDHLRDILLETLQPATTPAEARDTIMDKISGVTVIAPTKSKAVPVVRLSRWTPAIAGSLLVIGILLGLGLAQTILVRRSSVTPEAVVPIQIANLEGTVLVKHRASDTWEQLSPSSHLRLGDTVQSCGNSGTTLLFGDKSEISVSSNSTVSLELYDETVKFKLSYGTVRAALTDSHKPFFVSTPQGQVQALGTEFTVSVK